MSGTSEIVEVKEELNVKSRGNEKVRKNFMSRQGRVYSIEDDIDRLFESASINKTSVKAEALQKNPMKRPIRANYSLVSGNGRSDSVNLKQALRGLCISQASELAAMKKRPVKPLSMNKGKKNLLEISFPGKIIANLSEELPESVEVFPFAASVGKISIKTTVDKDVPFPSQALSGKSSALDVNDLVSTAENSPGELPQLDKCRTSMLTSATYPNSHGVDSKVKEASSGSTRLIIPVLLRRNFNKGKAKMESVSTRCTSRAAEVIPDTNLSSKTKTVELVNKENNVLSKHDKSKEVFSQSSISSAGEQCSSTSEESSASGSNRCSNRPHMSKDLRWDDIHSVQKKYGFLSLRHFKLLKRLGSGDIGTVYLAELVGSNCLFALKVMDNEFLTQRKKLERAQIEREILQMLDHPFLPTLYTHFTTDKLSCLVMEYCPRGDMHVMRSRQTSRCFPEQATRFYVAEVLLALEYLHMLGIVYRDLKPENILVREDGHIMLTDFDLSLRCVVNPTLLKSSSPTTEPTNKISSSCCSELSCIDPFSLQPSCQVSCFTPRLLSATPKTRKLKSDLTALPQLVAEPTDARSNSFVGTHEYLAPEIVIGEGHGSAVDWWTYGIFLYELLYGKTPFKGSTNEETLDNVVSESLKFPETPLVSFHAKDLISRLLIKSPEDRLGFVKGATEVKQHPFFDGLNWALIRCASPPEPPGLREKNKSIGVESSGHIEFELF